MIKQGKRRLPGGGELIKEKLRECPFLPTHPAGAAYSLSSLSFVPLPEQNAKL